jgi:hypothetical protein
MFFVQPAQYDHVGGCDNIILAGQDIFPQVAPSTHQKRKEARRIKDYKESI